MVISAQGPKVGGLLILCGLSRILPEEEVLEFHVQGGGMESRRGTSMGQSREVGGRVMCVWKLQTHT